jgi:malonate-semialdehyde dehydrogenase (acetylating)/methylmalonate-semialdehyde dehydrogenase
MKNYINGEWVESNSTTMGDVWNPAQGEKIAQVAYGTSEDVDKAVKAAKDAYWDWRTTPPLTRARYLFRLKDAFEENFEEIARVLTTEQGKCIDEARGEVRRMIENVEHATGVTTLMTGYTLEDIAKDIDCMGHRQPLGVFAGIVPYNFPGMVAWWFLPYALVCGNTYIIKPSELVPMTQTKIFEIIDEVGFPEGVVNMVHGSRDVVNGKNIVAVMPDAELEASMPSMITSFYGCTGQRCLSGSVLVPVGDVADELVDKFTSAAKVMKVGSGLDEQSGMGPLATAAHKEKVLGYIEKGIEEGADLIMDGRGFTVDEYPNGFFVGPTLFDNVKPDMTIAKEEIFGPVVSVVRAKDLDEVIDLINTRGFANAACIYTNDGATAREFKYRVVPSMVGINIGIAAPMSFFPFGGSGSSMFGDTKAHGQEIFNFFTDTKVVIQRWF